jgi:hypothetical protein
VIFGLKINHLATLVATDISRLRAFAGTQNDWCNKLATIEI